ncbi:MAG: M55 family metallopeptidase [Defluviitaleaceae bacterium]|nr:M55 family metallopeptidase [Defluviitaleaceae bacterium]
MEGVSGVDTLEMVASGNPYLTAVSKGENAEPSPEYRHCIQRLMADLNAAIDGAFLGGASHVTVLDSHGGCGGNFDFGLLDKRAEVDTRPNGKWWASVDESYHGTFFIGAHAMAGTGHGFLDHTMSSIAIFDHYINGRKFGELGMWALVCSHFNVPMIMVSGDEAAIYEAVQFFGDIETAAVKRAITRNRARLFPEDQAVEAIRQAAKRAVEKTEKIKPIKPLLPMEVKTVYTRSDHVDDRVCDPRVERLDGRTLRMVSDNYLDFWI